MSSDLQTIIGDRTSGASALYRRTLDLFITDAAFHTPDRLKKAVTKLKKQFPDMAVFAYLEQKLTKVDKKSIAARLGALRDEADQAKEAICRAAARFWKKPRRIVTISQSSVVLSAIIAGQDKVTSVLVSESSPKKEGVITAGKLAALGISVELVVDAALPGKIEKDDLILFGADCITKKYIINKTGSYPLALAAARAKARTFVLAEPFKCLSESQPDIVSVNQPPSEILATSQNHLHVTNIYFEKVPIELIDRIITG